MKVLFVSVIRDLTGYCHGSWDYIGALDSVGVDVVPRAIKLNGSYGPIPPRIEELESKSSHGCDTVIQYCLPPHMVYNGNFKKNIGLFANETYSLGDTSWARHLNQMDEVWVINDQMKEACLTSGVTKPITVVKHPIDLDRLKTPAQPIQNPLLEGKFVFYFIGEFSRRKNVTALLQAFHSEFDRTEDVAIVIKINVPGMNSQQSVEFMKKYCHDIKLGLKIYNSVDRYINEFMITDYLTEYQMMQIHASCNCMVAPSYGEAWNIPVAEAMALGKTPIVTNTGGLKELITHDVGWPVEANVEPCFGMIDTFPDLYTANDEWDSICIPELRAAMRDAFSDNILRKKKSLAGIKRAYNYSYDAVGSHMKKLLEN